MAFLSSWGMLNASCCQSFSSKSPAKHPYPLHFSLDVFQSPSLGKTLLLMKTFALLALIVSAANEGSQEALFLYSRAT